MQIDVLEYHSHRLQATHLKHALSNLLHGNRIVYPAKYLACTYGHLDDALGGLPQCISVITQS